ncbi:hypothetical protein EST38_g8191 [Candolleomyces aberdarensis]|uniref:Nephrocystin 3-like N-terminal domain-containing protein n=1 Tax=Candolleomyces aberdarensis TaxID=2316362 RepID=A0A4Q2DDS9_9AGAR|nr:hypothetical protein EST38_g8191 [Candolleomyces aberdarensis]
MLFDLTRRLFELLQPIPDASHTRDRKLLPPDSACFPGTRKVVIKVIITWVSSSVWLQRKHIFYLSGFAGSGKSAIAQELCNRGQGDFRLVASFFFYQGATDRSQIGGLPNALAIQLAKAIPEAAPLILAAVEGDPDLASTKSRLALSARLQALFYGPFETIVGRGSLVQKWTSCPYLIVIDALDECEDKQGVQELLDCMFRFFKNKPFIPLRVFITSRVEQHIHVRLNGRGVRIEDLADHSSREDVETFMHAAFDTHTKGDPIVQEYIRKNGSWPNPSDTRKLVDYIGGSFSLASALFRFIFHGSGSQDGQLTPMDRLPLSLNLNPGLDALYSATLARSERLPHFREVISTLALIKTPLPVPGIAELLGLPTYAVSRVLLDLQAIIRAPDTDLVPVTFCHPSLRDFLTTEYRAGPFYVPPTFHLHLFFGCFVVSLKDRRRESSLRQWSKQTVVAYSVEYEDSHWREGHHVFDNQTARSMILNLCSQARRCPPLPESHAFYLDKLGIELLDMFKHKESMHMHIERVASLHREALTLRTSSDKARASTLDNLGIALCMQFEATGSTHVVEEAISLFRETRRLRPSPHPHLPVSLNNLGNALYALFQRSGCTDHIIEAIGVHREALGIRSSPDVDRSFSLDNLGNALHALYEDDGAISHIEEAISLYREALSLQHRPSTLSNLGDALRSRGEHSGCISDHDDAISLLERALSLLEGCSLVTRRWPLMNIGIAFYSRFRTSGSIEDLMQAIPFLRESLNLISSHRIYRHKSLRYLIMSLQVLYERNQSLLYLEEAIKHTRELLNQHYTVEHKRRGEWLDRLISLLRMMHVATGSRDAWNEITKIEDELKN